LNILSFSSYGQKSGPRVRPCLG